MSAKKFEGVLDIGEFGDLDGIIDEAGSLDRASFGVEIRSEDV